MNIKLYRIVDDKPFFEAEDIEVLYSNGTYSFRGVPIEDRFTLAKIQWHNESPWDSYTAETQRSLTGVNRISIDTGAMRVFNNQGDYLFSPKWTRYNTGMGNVELVYNVINENEVLINDDTYIYMYHGERIVCRCINFYRTGDEAVMYGKGLRY